MDITENITEALSQMDPLDDDQWTSDGAPRVEVVAELSEIEGLKRADIINAAPQFSRENQEFGPAEPPEQEVVEVEVNTQGYNHPEIVAAQEAYDKATQIAAKAKAEEIEAGEHLDATMNRLMRVKEDKTANQLGIMAVIKSSTESRAQRMAEFNANRQLILGAGAAKSPLDEGLAKQKKARDKM